MLGTEGHMSLSPCLIMILARVNMTFLPQMFSSTQSDFSLFFCLFLSSDVPSAGRWQSFNLN